MNLVGCCGFNETLRVRKSLWELSLLPLENKLWSKRKTVGIRIPDNPIALKIVDDLGNPIISTSATNRKGDVLYDPYEIKSIFNLQVDLMLSLGNLSGISSSVIDLSGDEPVLVRKGAGDVSLFL